MTTWRISYHDRDDNPRTRVVDGEWLDAEKEAIEDAGGEVIVVQEHQPYDSEPKAPPSIKLSKGQRAWLADYRMLGMGYSAETDEWHGLWLEVQAGREITELESLEDLCGSDIDRWEFGDRDKLAAQERGYALRMMAKIQKARTDGQA